MEKITKEELMEELKLGEAKDADLDKIAGGAETKGHASCMQECIQRNSYETCLMFCM